jgi:ribosomal-protein-alanine N-acetyltransferase
MIFQTERLMVRPYTMGDLDDFFRLNRDAEVMRYIRPVQTFQQTKEFLVKIIRAYDERPGTGRWGLFLTDGGQFAGSFAIIPVEKTEMLQLGYALLKEYWGKGYASEAVKGGIAYAFDKLGLEEIAGITFPANLPSQKVLVNNGFVFEKVIVEEGKKLHLFKLYKAKNG